jgi:cobalamin synthase
MAVGRVLTCILFSRQLPHRLESEMRSGTVETVAVVLSIVASVALAVLCFSMPKPEWIAASVVLALYSCVGTRNILRRKSTSRQ